MIGFINVNKPSGITSNAVVSKIRQALHIKQVGHMGTLDPMACGVLPIAVGKATRMFDYFLDKEKKYSAIFEFGYETDTLDKEGKVTFVKEKIPSLKELKTVLPELIGEVDQMPPQYSAKSVNGVRAYQLARQGKTVELKPKRVLIHDIKVFNNDKNSYRFEIVCSSGTYVRSICRDIAYKLGTFATMTYLQRTASGAFRIEEAVSLDNIDAEKLKQKLITVEKVFDRFKVIEVDSENFNKLANGISIYMAGEQDGKVFVKSAGKLLGLGNLSKGELKMATNLFDEDSMQQ